MKIVAAPVKILSKYLVNTEHTKLCKEKIHFMWVSEKVKVNKWPLAQQTAWQQFCYLSSKHVRRSPISVSKCEDLQLFSVLNKINVGLTGLDMGLFSLFSDILLIKWWIVTIINWFVRGITKQYLDPVLMKYLNKVNQTLRNTIN